MTLSSQILIVHHNPDRHLKKTILGGTLHSEIDLFFSKQDFILYDLFKPKYSKGGLIMWANALYADPAKIKV